MELSQNKMESAPGMSRGNRRYDSIDLLRGLAMIFMAFDHVRDFLSWDDLSQILAGFNTDLALLAVMRWLTHFSAPIFFFFAGTGAYLSLLRSRSKKELSHFLFTRGLWLVFLELTVILSLGWRFNFHYDFMYGYVIWALGWSMVVMAGLVYLPPWAVAAFGIVLIAGHNMFDGIPTWAFGNYAWLWMILHDPDDIAITSTLTLNISYAIIPWVGVMAAGFGFGKLLQYEYHERKPRLLILGAVLTTAFFLLRLLNHYGDPVPWVLQDPAWLTIISFFDLDKYPPSLLFLLMTLGPVIFMLAFIRDDLGGLRNPIVVFGRVPMFFYLLHLPLIHLLTAALAATRYPQIDFVFTGVQTWPGSAPYPDGYGYGLFTLYLVWVAVVVILYPACIWFAKFKQKNRSPWLSYL